MRGPSEEHRDVVGGVPAGRVTGANGGRRTSSGVRASTCPSPSALMKINGPARGARR